MLLLLLTACSQIGHHNVYRPTCDVVATDIADDEPLSDSGVTVAELAASAAGARKLTAADANYEPVEAEVRVERAEGTATFFAATPGSEVTRVRGWGGDVTLTIGVICVDSVEFPVDLSITTADGAVDLAGPAAATVIEHDGPLDAATLIDVGMELHAEDSPVAPTPAGAREGHAFVQYVSGQLTSLHAYWESSSSGAGDNVVEYPIP